MIARALPEATIARRLAGATIARPLPGVTIARSLAGITIARSLRAAAFALAVSLAGASCSHLVILHDPLTAAEHNDLGVAYEKSGDRRLAERQYHAALRKDRRLVRARVNLGNLHAAESRWASAEREYRRALGIQPGDPDALNNLAYALLRRGRRLGEAEALAVAAVRASGARDSIYRATLDEIRGVRSRGPADP